MTGRVVHCKKEPYDTYIGRGGCFGNPFEIGRDGTREEVIQKFRTWLTTGEQFECVQATEVKRRAMLASIPRLRGKVLGCWCHPKACHGHVLLELVLEDRCPLPEPTSGNKV